MSTLLAFDTATEHMSVALRVDGQVWTHEAPGGALASAGLIPAILDMLTRAGIALQTRALRDSARNSLRARSSAGFRAASC